VALSVAGVDYRRWWALASVAALAMILRLTSAPRGPVSRNGTEPTGALGWAAFAGVALFAMPLGPLGMSHLQQILRLLP